MFMRRHVKILQYSSAPGDNRLVIGLACAFLTDFPGLSFAMPFFRGFFCKSAVKKTDDDSFINSGDQGQLYSDRMSRRRRYEVLCLLIGHGAAHDFIHRFGHYHPLAGGKRDKRVRPGFDIFNQFGVENKGLAREPRQFDHV
jgi:hypothetical protein